MTRRLIIPHIVLFCLYFISCNSDKKNISSYLVVTKDFENSISVDGITDPLQSINIMCPRAGSGGNIAYLIEDGVFVKKGDTLCVIENTYIKERYDQDVANLENLTANIEKSKADLKMQYALLEAQVQSNKAQTQIAHLDSLQLQYYSPKQKKIKELELEKVEIEKEKLTKKLASLDIIQQTEIKKQELQIQRTSLQVKSTEQMLSQLVLLAPNDGLTIRAESPITGQEFGVGDNVYNGMPIVILPKMDKMKVKITASETDFRQINTGDSISYSFDALADNIAWGKVVNKMPVGKELKKGSKIKFFDIEASIDSTIKMPEPGFTAYCQIFMKQINDTIAIPQISIFSHDSIKVVYVERNSGYEMREIKLAESSAKEAVISKGLVLNEKIALRKPPSSDIKFRKLLSDSIPLKYDLAPL